MGLQDHDILLLDGATGTELDRRGVDVGMPLWSARAMIEAPEILESVHRAYLEAGAGAIITNTFRTHERSLAKAGLGDRAEELTNSAVQIARTARDSIAPQALVLGSVAPLEDCYTPDLAPEPEECRRAHGQLIRRLVEAGADLVLVETMCSAHESLAAVEAAVSEAADRWGICFCLKSDGPPGVLLDGTELADIVSALQRARFIGINCVAAPVLADQVRHLRCLVPEGLPIAAYGNVGHADEEGGWVCTDAIEPARYADHAMAWVEAGASIVGGCCGTTPATIEAIRSRINCQAE